MLYKLQNILFNVIQLLNLQLCVRMYKIAHKKFQLELNKYVSTAQ